MNKAIKFPPPCRKFLKIEAHEISAQTQSKHHISILTFTSEVMKTSQDSCAISLFQGFMWITKLKLRIFFFRQIQLRKKIQKTL